MIERAIVQDVVSGRGGATVREYRRPREVRAMATRLQAWRRTPEECQQCRSAAAMVIRSGRAYCASCDERYEARSAAVISARGRFVREERAPDPQAQGIVGHYIVFDRESVDLGGFIEVVRPAAVDRSLGGGADIRALWSHDTSLVIGRTGPQTLTLRKTRTGLYGEITVPEWAASYLETVERGDVSQASFGFQVLEDRWTFTEDLVLRELLDIVLHEISPVGFPAYPDTSIRVERLSARRERETWDQVRLAR